MEKDPQLENSENTTERNLLTDFSETVDLMNQVEGGGWYKNYIDDIKLIVERLKKFDASELDSEGVVNTIYGDGGVTRWMIMGNGEVRFSAFHDTGDSKKTKTHKAEALGFKLF